MAQILYSILYLKGGNMVVNSRTTLQKVQKYLNDRFKDSLGLYGVSFTLNDEECCLEAKITAENKTGKAPITPSKFEEMCMGVAFRASVEILVQQIIPDATLLWGTISPVVFVRVPLTIPKMATPLTSSSKPVVDPSVKPREAILASPVKTGAVEIWS